MSSRQAPADVAGDATEFRNELLARFGLQPGASIEDVEIARDRLVAFLGSVPPSLRPWAAGELATVNQAFVLLSGGIDAARGSAVDDDADVVDDDELLDDEDEGDATDGPAGAAGDDEDGGDQSLADVLDDIDLDEDSPGPVRRVPRDRMVSAGKLPQARVTTAGLRPARGRPATAGADRSWHNKMILALLCLLVIAIGTAVYFQGKSRVPGITGTPTASASPAPTVDQAKVGELMTKLQANPKDVQTLWALGEVYIEGQDFKTAAGFLQKVLAINPKNTDALVALGICYFNTGDATGAEKQWLAAVAVDPKLIAAHYNLGFLYLSQNKLDMVKAEWTKVVQIDPNSDYAKTVGTHLSSLDKTPAPTASASPTGR